ncbi:MAG TPA: DUF3500 domain-containing protein [Verrucomicrobiae bacterium]|nr:DUF3500 domain-containing protein [Verrucomicrobiae bacterium]
MKSFRFLIVLSIFTQLAAISVRGHTPAEEMAGAANHFLAALTSEQRAKAVFELKSDERLNWHFIPRERKGLPLKEMTPAQRHLAQALLNSGLSQRGYGKATTIMSLEEILRELEQGRGPTRDPELYFVSIFGKPESKGTWGWRFEGHHLALNWTVIDGKAFSATPSMFGTNPAEVREGPRKGLRVLAAEEDLARELVQSLNAKQKNSAIYTNVAPRDIITGADRKVKPLSPAGLAASTMTKTQSDLLWRIIEEYVRRSRPELANEDLKKIEKAGRNKIHFAWAGSVERGQGHYYRVQGPTFLLEYDNTQNNANHVHAVWRDFEGDFGEDLLRKHYEQHHSR